MLREIVTEHDPSPDGETQDQQRKQLLGLFEKLPEAAIIHDEKGEILNANENAVEYLGYSREELLSMNAGEFFFTEYAVDEARQRWERMDVSETTKSDSTHERKDGSTYSTEVWVAKTETQGQVQYIATFRDITARKKDQKKLKRRLEAIETTTDGIGIFNADMEFIYANQAHADVYGYDESDAFYGNSWRMLYDDEQIEGIEENVLPELRETGSWRGETTGRKEGGTPVPTELSISVLDSGELVAIVRDITERKEREQKLQRSEYAIESALSGIAIANLDGELISANPSFLDLWGYETENEVLGKSVIGFWKRTEEAAKVRSTVEETGHWNGERLAVRKDGTTFDAQSAVSMVTDDDGTPLALMASFVDITARKKGERELQRQKEQLEEFAGVVSHDLRNPLNVAKGRLELAQDEYDGDHLELVETALDRMEAIIADTLVLAQEGQPVGESEPVPIHQFTQQCWEMVEAPEATLEINDEFSIYADRDRLLHAFENLFRNAVEHSEEEVTIRVGRLDDIGFYVEDDGPGIPEDERTDVLEAGYSQSAGGTGFGLAIVNRIAEAHGWTLSITDSNEGGARFEFANVDIRESVRTAEEPSES